MFLLYTSTNLNYDTRRAFSIFIILILQLPAYINGLVSDCSNIVNVDNKIKFVSDDHRQCYDLCIAKNDALRYFVADPNINKCKQLMINVNNGRFVEKDILNYECIDLIYKRIMNKFLNVSYYFKLGEITLNHGYMTGEGVECACSNLIVCNGNNLIIKPNDDTELPVGPRVINRN